MCPWRAELRGPKLWLALAALLLGGAAGWAITGHYALGLGAAALALSGAAYVIVGRRLSPCWGLGLLPAYTLAGWLPSGAGWHGALPAVLLILATAVGPQMWRVCRGHVSSRVVKLGIVGSYGVLGVSITLGALPLWCLAALLVLPAAVHTAQAGGAKRGGHARLSAFPVLFVGQVIIGFVIQGVIR